MFSCEFLLSTVSSSIINCRQSQSHVCESVRYCPICRCMFKCVCVCVRIILQWYDIMMCTFIKIVLSRPWLEIFLDVHPYLENWSNWTWASFSNGWLNHLTSYVSHHTIEVWGSGTHGRADPYRSLGRSTKLWSGYGGALWSFSGRGNSRVDF